MKKQIAHYQAEVFKITLDQGWFTLQRKKNSKYNIAVHRAVNAGLMKLDGNTATLTRGGVAKAMKLGGLDGY